MARLWIALLLVGAAAVPARAEEEASEKAQARLLLGQGNALFEKGDLKGALVDFRAAYSLYPSPKLLVNAAAAERELGDLAGAANDLRRFIDEAQDDDPFLVDKAKSDLKALEKKVGRIALSGWPPKSALEIDGRAARDPAYVKPGAHHVKARSAAGGEDERDLTVGAGESVEVPPTGAPPVVSSTSSLEPAAAALSPQKKSRWWIGVLVGGVVLVAAGVGLGVGLGSARGNPQPLQGDLGTFNFSSFH